MSPFAFGQHKPRRTTRPHIDHARLSISPSRPMAGCYAPKLVHRCSLGYDLRLRPCVRDIQRCISHPRCSSLGSVLFCWVHVGARVPLRKELCACKPDLWTTVTRESQLTVESLILCLYARHLRLGFLSSSLAGCCGQSSFIVVHSGMTYVITLALGIYPSV